MSRTSSTPLRLLGLFASALLGLACQPTGDAGKGEAKSEVKSEAKPAGQDEVKTEAKSEPPHGVESESSPVSDAGKETGPGPVPAWFDPNAFEHAAIIRQDHSSTRLPNGKSSAMIVLELPPGTTPEQCIERARAKFGESIKDIPATTTTPQGYLEIQGKTDRYEYTAVCGVAKGKPTMFMSYTQ